MLKLPMYVDPVESGTRLVERPQVRADCQEGGRNAARPCRQEWCRHHIAGAPKESCALDVAERGEHTLEEVAEHFGVTRERIRQIEEIALHKLARYRSFLTESN